MHYDYLALELTRDRTAHRTLAEHLAGPVAQALAHAEGEVVAQFSPLLGFASNEASVLVRWIAGEGDTAVLAAIEGSRVVSRVTRHRLTPTLRPLAGARPRPGGIYVHNWFTIDADAADEFVALSGAAWPDFEARFEAEIFGLFRAEESPEDKASGAVRLLLMTRYCDLGEWQASRDPTTEAMQIFARRRELTRVSLARSCVLVTRA